MMLMEMGMTNMILVEMGMTNMMLVEMVNLHNGERHKYDIADENGYDK